MNCKKAALYIRVSTVMQADRDSLPLQRSDLINYAKLVLNIDDYEVFEDAGFSAKNTDRPRYQEMMDRVRRHEFSHILVWKIDRISRNLIDFCEMYEEIKKYDTAFISKNEQFDTSSAMGEAMLKIILVFAELERKLTGERVLSVMIDRASRGLWNGGFAPFGYDLNKEVDFPFIKDSESKIVKYIFDLYEELESTVAVARTLHTNGYVTRNGFTWSNESVYRILKNPFYIGTYRYNYRKASLNPRKRKDEGEWIILEDNHEAIISKEQFYRVQETIKKNHKGGSQAHRQSSIPHIFSGIVFCQNCSRRYTPGPGPKRKDGIPSSRYNCANYNSGDPCSGTIGDILLVPFVFNYLANYCELADKISYRMKNSTIEKILLKGNSFVHVRNLSSESIEDIKFFMLNDLSNSGIDPWNIEIQKPKQIIKPTLMITDEIKKYETAITRLEEIYLFSSEAMNQSEFIVKKARLQEKINELKQKEIDEYTAPHENDSKDLFEFISGVVFFKSLIKKNVSYDYEFLMKYMGRETLSKLFQAVISKIYVKDSVPQVVIFKNGLVHQFIWEPGKRKATSKINIFLKKYESEIDSLLDDKGIIKHKDLRDMSGINKSQSAQIIRALVSRNLIEQAPELGKGCYKRTK